MRQSIIPLLLVAALVLPGMAGAQDRSEPEKWYEVEVIVFRQPESLGDDQEAWPAVPEPFGGRQLVTLGPAMDGTGAPAYTRLGRHGGEMEDIAERLRDSSDYEVLLHTGWRQPGTGDDRARPVTLPLGWEPPHVDLLGPWSAGPPSLDDLVVGNGPSPSPFAYLPPSEPLYGTLRLVRRRYLHLETDLRYRRSGVRMQVTDTAGQLDGNGGPATATPGGTIVYPLRQKRRMRSGEIHYLDHPALGLIVQTRELERE